MPLECPVRNLPAPYKIATPISPTKTPRTLLTINRSSPNAAIIRTVNRGVVAFMTDASPLGICFCPKVISKNGATLLRRLITKNENHSLASAGSLIRRNAKTDRINGAAIATRPNTIVQAGNSLTATPTKKNEPPQRMDKIPSRIRRSEEHTSELQSLRHLVCRLLLE